VKESTFEWFKSHVGLPNGGLILGENSMTPMCQLRTMRLYGAKERQTMVSNWGLVVI